LQRDETIISRRAGSFLFGDEDNKGFIDIVEVCPTAMEVSHEGHEIGLDKIPKGFIEGRPKPIRAWTCITVHT
jgi:hypothetical protein